MLRVFTVEAGINVDFSKIIYRKDKISFEQNLADIHLMVNVLSQSSVDIVIPDKDGTKKQRHMKKSSIISSRSLDHSE